METEDNLNVNGAHPTPVRPTSGPSKTLALWQGLATSLAAFFLLNLALGFFLFAVLEIITPNAGDKTDFSLSLLAGGFFTVFLLLIPPILFAFFRFFGLGEPTWLTALRFPPLGVLIFFYPLVLVGGTRLSAHPLLAFFLLPLFHVAAIGIPIVAILQISQKDLKGISPQRKWASLSVGLTLTPLLIFILELFAILSPLILLSVWISLDPERSNQLNQLNEALRQPSADSQAIMDILQPYLSEPAVVFTLLFLAGFVVPLIEEALKPLGVWMFFGRTRGALDGFGVGALCGAGYALLESFLLGSTQSDWLFAVLGRSGTGAIHIFTAALVGAALTTAWQNHRYLHLAIAYLLAVFFHGAWNSLVVLAALRSISESNRGFWQLPLAQNLALAAPLAILFLTCLAILGLWSFNTRMRCEQVKMSSTL